MTRATTKSSKRSREDAMMAPKSLPAILRDVRQQLRAGHSVIRLRDYDVDTLLKAIGWRKKQVMPCR